MTAVLCALMIDMLVQFEPLWLPFWPIGLSWFLKATQNLLLSDVFFNQFFCEKLPCLQITGEPQLGEKKYS
jgi:hypothetical protein